jgi:hypothetical protein
MTQRSRTNRLPRLLAVGLVTGVGSLGLAGAAQAEPTTVDAGRRAPVAVTGVSPAALPTSLGTETTRRTSWVTVTL